MEEKIILASNSPRRINILKEIGIKFDIRKDEVKEIIFEDPAKTVLYNSKIKIKSVIKDNEKGIGFDTIVVYKNKIIGKPRDKEDAYNILKELSGKEHRVYSGFTFINNNKEVSDYDVSIVKFRRYFENEILNYIRTGEPMDKAGAYALQGEGIKFIESVKGSISNVIGVPLEKMINLFDRINIRYDKKKLEEYLWNLKQSVGKMIKLE